MDEYRFDREDWMPVLHSKESLESGRQGFAITGPHDIHRLEEYRARAASRCDLGPSVPVDVFILGLGRSPKRAMTKIGGVPHRPPGLPWPTRTDGEPMTFLAQYRFAESRDLLGDLPGDILLVFIESHELSHRSPQDFFRFEWHPLQWDEPDEIEYVPCLEWEFVNCYGVRHRTVDYVHDVPTEVFRAVAPKAV